MLIASGAQEGLSIPLQPVARGGGELIIPISDAQISSFEEYRAGSEVNFDLRLRAVGFPDSRDVLGCYTTNFSPPFSIPRDRWIAVLDGFGLGIIRILELPPPPSPNSDGSWERAAELLQDASRRLAKGETSEAVAAVRPALERIAESTGVRAGVERQKDELFTPYVRRLTQSLKSRHEKRGADAFALLADLIMSTFGWSSSPGHQGFDVSARDDATFAVNLGVALYSYLAKVHFDAPGPSEHE
jgi:hypothetical protein